MVLEKMFRFIKRWFKRGVVLSVLFAITGFCVNFYVDSFSKEKIYAKSTDCESAYTGIVLGARVYKSGRPSSYLRDRLDASVILYQEGKIKRFLLSGDHGKKSYDEVNQMRKYLIGKGVPNKHIFMDHAGFDTYSTMARAKKVFEVDKAIVITQDFHLERSLFLAHKHGIDAYGFIADKTKYRNLKYMYFREFFAKMKAFFDVVRNREPRFLGDKIPITGSSSASHD